MSNSIRTTPSEGTRFGLQDDQFELGKELGGGSQGRVHTCTRLGTGNVYAAKVVNVKILEMRMHALVNLRREINIMRELHHPRIVNLREAFWEGDICFIVMDLARGGDLHGKIALGKGLEGGELSCKHIALQLLEGIGYMHSHRIIHRDLKPENVLVVRSYAPPPPHKGELLEVKIADFGLSKCLHRAGEGGPGMTACGTLDFLAPEVVESSYDERIDFWSFGVVLYMTLCGAYPFNIEGVQDVRMLRTARIATSEAWQAVSFEGRDMVHGLLTVDPFARLGLDGCTRHKWLADQAAQVEAHRLRARQAWQKLQASFAPKAGEDRKPRRARLPPQETSIGLLSSSQSDIEGVPSPLGVPALEPQGAIRHVEGWVGSAVDSIELHFRDGTVCYHGAHGGKTHGAWHLHQHELVIAVIQETRPMYLGNSVTLYTSECQIISLQGGDARRRNRMVAPVGSQIVGLQFENSNLIGIHMERVSASGHGAVEQISGWVGSAVDGLSFHLRDGKVRRYGGEGGTEVPPLRLDADDFLMIVEQSRMDAFLGNSFAFYTSKGQILEIRGMESARTRRFVSPRGSQICDLQFDGSLLVGVSTCPDSGDLGSSQLHRLE